MFSIYESKLGIDVQCLNFVFILLVNDFSLQFHCWGQFSALNCELDWKDGKINNFLGSRYGFRVCNINSFLNDFSQSLTLKSLLDGLCSGSSCLDIINNFIGQEFRRLEFQAKQSC
jgi:hypothetical protein